MKYLQKNYTKMARGMPLNIATNDVLGDLRDYGNPSEIRLVALPDTSNLYGVYTLNKESDPEKINGADFVAVTTTRGLAKLVTTSSFLQTLPKEIRMIRPLQQSMWGVFVSARKPVA